MNAPRLSSRLRQQGMVTVMAVLLLITVVIFALSQTLGITGSNSIDNESQMDSVDAFFLAESGLERGEQVLKTAAIFTESLCANSITGNYLLGRGSFTLSGISYAAGSIIPNTPCDSSGATQCSSCVIQSVGTVGSASRTVQGSINLTSANGKACNTLGGTKDCSNPVMNLKNTNIYTSVAVFNLAYDRKGQSIFGACTGTGCALQWLTRSKQTSADMGNSVTIAAGASYPITTTLQSTNYSYVGALFPGASSSGPAILGTYWDQPTNGNAGTVGKGNAGGVPSFFTNNGVATGSTTTIAPIDFKNTTQTSTKWCYGGDTLIWGIGGSGSSTSDQVTNVVFNASGTPAQNIPLTQIAKYPMSFSTEVPSTHDVYAQTFYARNPNLSAKPDVTAGSFVVNEAYVIKTLGLNPQFTSSGNAMNSSGAVDAFAATPNWHVINVANTAFVATGAGSGTGTATPLNPFSLNASSYKGNGTGAIGATFTASRSGTTLTVTGFSGAAFPLQIISPGAVGTGDILGGVGVTAGTITMQLTSNEPLGVPNPSGRWGGRGTYTTSSSQNLASQAMTATSITLNVSSCIICYFQPGDTISGLIANKAINLQLPQDAVKFPGESTGDVGRYTLSSSGAPALPTSVVSASTLRAYSGTNPAVTPGATIYLPSTPLSTQSWPTTPTRIAIVSGPGTFAANTVAAAAVNANSATKSFTVSPAPTAALNVATICGGTCAFFDAPSNAASQTHFFFDTTISDYWSSAFMCLSGVDVTPPTVVTNPNAAPSSWHEVVN